MSPAVDKEISILIADDHSILASGISSLLSKLKGFRIIGVVEDGEMVLEELKAQPIDIIIMDINMPKKDGISTTAIVKKEYPDTKVIILSMYDREGYIQNALDAGVDGYLLKNTNLKEIEEAVKRVITGKSYFSQDITEKMANKMKVHGTEVEGAVKLSDLEKKILQLISKGYTSKEVADQVATSEHNVVAYRKNLLHKFDAKNVSHLIRIALEKGYLS